MNSTLFPEHQTLVDELAGLQGSGRFPHAVMLTSDSGLGLIEAGRELAMSLLFGADGASTPAGDVSGSKAERFFEAGTHGDFRSIEVPDGKLSIGIDQIREACEFVTKTAGYGTKKVLVINHADKMTAGASNALLKTLEEPQGDSLVLLLTQRSWLLPVTIRSRCQSWKLPPLAVSTCMSFLSDAEQEIGTPESVVSSSRLLERRVMAKLTERQDMQQDISAALQNVIMRRSAGADLTRSLMSYDLPDALEELVRAIEEKALVRSESGPSLMVILTLHRLVASLLQRVRSGSVPARETACFELGVLTSRAAENNMDALNEGLSLMGV